MSTPTSLPTQPGLPPRAVTGFCPMGCGRHLVLASGGSVVCAAPGCPRPTAVVQLLSDPETDHIVHMGERDYLIVHPLHERLDGALLECHLQRRFAALSHPPLGPGDYRAYLRHEDDEIDWDPLPPDTTSGAPGDRPAPGGGIW